MAKEKQSAEASEEKKARRQLQRAESAHIKAQQQLEDAQSRLSKAAARLERRAAALVEARAAVAAHAATPTAQPVVGETLVAAMEKPSPATETLIAPKSAAASSNGAAAVKAPRPRRARRSPANAAGEPMSGDGGSGQPLGVVVP
jgi:hypothetical protein